MQAGHAQGQREGVMLGNLQGATHLANALRDLPARHTATRGGLSAAIDSEIGTLAQRQAAYEYIAERDPGGGLSRVGRQQRRADSARFAEELGVPPAPVSGVVRPDGGLHTPPDSPERDAVPASEIENLMTDV